MKKLSLIIIVLICSLGEMKAQEGYDYTDQIQVLYGVLFNGDTIPLLNVPEISVTGHKFDNQQDEYWYNY